MKRITFILASIAATPILADVPTYSNATDAIVAPTPVTSSGTNWTGFYTGISGGSVSSDTAFIFVPGNVSHNAAVYGGYMGYNYDFGNIVIGAEYEYSFGESDASAIYFVDSISTIKARAGYDFGSLLVYGVGGYTMITMDGFAGDVKFDGMSYGAGADYRMTDHWSVGLEYLSYAHDDLGRTVDLQTLNARVSYAF